MAGIFTDAGERYLADVAFTTAGPLTVKLAKAAFTISSTIALAALTEANYPGYAAEPLVYLGLTPGSPSGRAVALFQAIVFVCTGPATPNQIYGYWIEGPGPIIVGIERFTGTPRPMILAGQTVLIDISPRVWCPT